MKSTSYSNLAAVIFLAFLIGLQMSLAVPVYNTALKNLMGTNRVQMYAAGMAATDDDFENAEMQLLKDLLKDRAKMMSRSEGLSLDLGLKRDYSGSQIAHHQQALDRASANSMPGRK